MPLDALVIGGGPAGCAAARLLSLWGHTVTLVTSAAGGHGALPESIPPSAGKLLDVIGVRADVEDMGFVRSTGNTVWWGDRETRVEYFADGALGWQVTADRLEAVLIRAASKVGVRVERRRATASEADASDAAFVIDCTGQAGLIARRRTLRRYEPQHRTVALIGSWRRDGDWGLPDETQTLIESYADGWAWSVPDVDGSRSVAAMVDPRSTDLTRGQSARTLYEAELAKTRRLAAMLRRAALVTGPTGWDASMYSATQYVSANVLLAGDAGSFVDPLSSAGVKKALASGWLAAVAVHTALVRPEMRHTALEFFAAREVEMYAGLSAITRRFMTDAAAGHAHPFWTDRTLVDPGSAGLQRNSASQAFDRIRSAETLSLAQAGGVRVEPRPAVNGCEIVLEPRLVTDTLAAGQRYAFDVDLIALVELAPAFDSVPALFEAYSRRAAPVAIPDFLAALATALAEGWLVWRDSNS